MGVQTNVFEIDSKAQVWTTARLPDWPTQMAQVKSNIIYFGERGGGGELGRVTSLMSVQSLDREIVSI